MTEERYGEHGVILVSPDGTLTTGVQFCRYPVDEPPVIEFDGRIRARSLLLKQGWTIHDREAPPVAPATSALDTTAVTYTRNDDGIHLMSADGVRDEVVSHAPTVREILIAVGREPLEAIRDEVEPPEDLPSSTMTGDEHTRANRRLLDEFITRLLQEGS